MVYKDATDPKLLEASVHSCVHALLFTTTIKKKIQRQQKP